MASIKCAHCKGTHQSVQEVRLCATKDVPAERLFVAVKVSGPGVPPGTVLRPAGTLHAKQEELQRQMEEPLFCGHFDKAGDLCEKSLELTAGNEPTHEDRLINLEHDPVPVSAGQLARLRAGKGISLDQVAKTQAKREARARVPVTEGYYKVGETIYKVQRAVHASGNLYAKELVTEPLDGSELNEAQLAAVAADPDKMFYQGKWEYVPGAIRRISGEQKLSMEECIAFGQLYGVCVRCGRTLTKEVSIARGMGDVCAGKGLVI